MNPEIYHFSEFVFPICELGQGPRTGESKILHYLGTGFSIGNEGYFLSAHHVLNQQSLRSCATETYIAAVVLSSSSEQLCWRPIRILEIEQYHMSDIVIGRLACPLPPFFTSKENDAFGWEDVHVFGYPDSRKKENRTGLLLFNPQFLKGYITRRLEVRDLMNPAWDPAYELSFHIPVGISGSPVFRRGKNHALVGIALGSVESTTSVHECVTIDEESGRYCEKVSKIEQFGIAARLSALADWQPNLAGGKRLNEIF